MDYRRSRMTILHYTTTLSILLLYVLTCAHCRRHRQRAYSVIDQYCPESCFCPRLEEVWCRDVPMTGIPSHMWPTLENLTIINADLNRLTSHMFSGYPYLKRLHLQSSNIRTIEPHAFSGLPRLRSLRLFGNDIDRLDGMDLAHLHHVKEVYLTGNNIKRIGRDAFYGSTRIGTLDLRNNPVDVLESGSFNGLRRVDHLLLPADLTVIEPGAFENLTGVHYLEIRQWKPKESTWYGVAPGTFRGLRDVKTIQIEKSDLGIIQPGAFDGLNGVEYLYIRNSMIGRVRKSSFTGMNGVRRLGLTKNIIDHIDYMTLFADLSISTDRIRQLDINKNRLNCTCPNNAWILYEDKVAMRHSSVLRNNTCSWPTSLEGADLLAASVRVRDWPCEYGKDTDHANVTTISLSVTFINLIILISRAVCFY